MAKRIKIGIKNLQIIFLSAFFVLVLLIDVWGIKFSSDALMNEFISVIITRGLGGVFAVMLAAEYKFDIFSFKNRNITKSLIIILPFIIVCINNLPIYALISGNAAVTKSEYIFMFLLSCLSIGFFEEMLFRGAILLMILKKMGGSRKQIFLGTVISSVIFALFHIFNLFAGAGVGETLLQVGYTFLTGCMWSLVLIITRNIWVCAALHAVYNFCGLLVVRLGEGRLWDTPTIIITAVIAVLAALYYIYMFTKIDKDNVDKLYNRETQIAP
ncbi:MAG: type II CAAX endopeptidase family protein [Clostridia bacterium]|nr:type II CAAX endopeptidase family protein [Clostridia bacterium]